MFRFELDILPLERRSPFPFRLGKLFYYRGLSMFKDQVPVGKDHFEVCFRLESDAEICTDFIGGKNICAPFPHALWKLPNQPVASRDNCRRDVLALLYPSESVRLFEQAGLIPREPCVPFAMNTEISARIEKIFLLVSHLYTPGVADQLDWLGFSLIKEILLAGIQQDAPRTMEQKIRNIAVHLTAHCAENPDFHSLAAQYQLPYTKFYREWSRCIDMTPHQFVINARLETAAELLKTTNMPISKIIELVNFSGTYAFYQRFREKYGISPKEYRQKQ